MIKKQILKIFKINKNEQNRLDWIQKRIQNLSNKQSILDAGAGEMRHRSLCDHLIYTSQDFCQYSGNGEVGLHPGKWDTEKIDIISDIANIPMPDSSYDNIICIEVLEHVPDPSLVIKELSRLLKQNGKLIVTAPFASMTHFAPYFFSTGFSRHWYEYQGSKNNLKINELVANGSWFDVFFTYCTIAPSFAKKNRGFIFKIILSMLLFPVLVFLRIFPVNGGDDTLCFGYFCIYEKC
jgi:SAM-dependent methyltransferase